MNSEIPAYRPDESAPEDTVPVRGTWWQRVRKIHPVTRRDLMAHRATMVIMRNDHHLEPCPAKSPGIHTPTGFYVSEAVGYFRLTKAIKPGWVSIHREGNPAPILEHGVPPGAYGSLELGRLMGGKLSSVVGGAIRSGAGDDWKTWLLYGGGAFLALLAFWWAWSTGILQDFIGGIL